MIKEQFELYCKSIRSIDGISRTALEKCFYAGCAYAMGRYSALDWVSEKIADREKQKFRDELNNIPTKE